MMKIGLSSYSLSRAIKAGEMDIFGAMDFVKEHNGEHIEIVPGSFGEMSVTLAEQIAQKAKNIQLDLSSYTIGANFIKETPEAVQAEVERIKKEVEIAARLGVTRMRHDCAWRDQSQCGYANFEKDLPMLADCCGQIADKAKEYGIVTSIENHGFYVQASERVLRLILTVNRDNFRTTMDVGNFLCADEDPEVAALHNTPYASMVHFKDFYIRKSVPCPEGFIKTPAGRFLRGAVTGEGDVDLPAIVRILKANNYDGFLSIEYEGREECKEGCTRALQNVRLLVENN